MGRYTWRNATATDRLDATHQDSNPASSTMVSVLIGSDRRLAPPAVGGFKASHVRVRVWVRRPALKNSGTGTQVRGAFGGRQPLHFFGRSRSGPGQIHVSGGDRQQT